MGAMCGPSLPLEDLAPVCAELNSRHPSSRRVLITISHSFLRGRHETSHEIHADRWTRFWSRYSNLARILCRNLSRCSHKSTQTSSHPNFHRISRGCSDLFLAAKSPLSVAHPASLAGVVGLGEFFSHLDEEETVFATQVFQMLDKDKSGALDLYSLHLNRHLTSEHVARAAMNILLDCGISARSQTIHS